jgi:hypothetical protein
MAFWSLPPSAVTAVAATAASEAAIFAQRSEAEVLHILRPLPTPSAPTTLVLASIPPTAPPAHTPPPRVHLRAAPALHAAPLPFDLRGPSQRERHQLRLLHNRALLQRG